MPNELEYEHHMSVETYPRPCDEVVIAMKKMQPDMKPVGMALAAWVEPHYFEHFLDPKNHNPRDLLDFIPHHCGANAPDGRGPAHVLRPSQRISSRPFT